MSTKRVAAIANKVVNRSREHKYVLSNGQSSLNTSTGGGTSLFPVTHIPQGDTVREREGAVCQPTSWRFTFSVGHSLDPTVANRQNYEVCRVILFSWRQDDTTFPTAADILEDGTALNNVHSSYKQKATNRYQILYDKRITLSLNSRENMATTTMIVKKLPKIIFQVGGALNGKNHYYVMFCTNNTETGVYGTTFDWFSTIRFTDA